MGHKGQAKIDYRNWFESAPDYYFVVDLHSGKILEGNQKVFFTFGCAREELVGQRLANLVANHHQEAIETLLCELRDRGEVQDREFDLLTGLDRIMVTTLNVNCLRDSAGEPQQGLFVFRDAREVIRRREVEADLKEQMVAAAAARTRIDELDAANNRLRQMQERLSQSERLATLGAVSANIGHEINNPLAIIKMIVASIKKKAKKKSLSENDFVKAIDQLDSTAERIAQIVKGLKGMTRDSAMDPIEWEDFNELVQSVIEMSRESHKGSGVIVRAEDMDKGMVYCRSGQLYQILMNLINNAVQAVCGQENCWVKISTEVADGFVSIFVRDSGKGIPEEIQNKIFLPLFTTKEKGQGTGLGLSISRDLVRSLDGEFYLKKDDPHTCFVVKLRWKKKKESAA